MLWMFGIEYSGITILSVQTIHRFRNIDRPASIFPMISSGFQNKNRVRHTENVQIKNPLLEVEERVFIIGNFPHSVTFEGRWRKRLLLSDLFHPFRIFLSCEFDRDHAIEHDPEGPRVRERAEVDMGRHGNDEENKGQIMDQVGDER